MTYFLVRLFGGSNGEKVGRHEVDSLQWWTGAVLTFSVSVTTYIPNGPRRVETDLGLPGRHVSLCRNCHLATFRRRWSQHPRTRSHARSRGRETEQTHSVGIIGHGHGLAVDPERSLGWA